MPDWAVKVEVVAPAGETAFTRAWMELPDRLRHRRVRVDGWGLGDEPEGQEAEAGLLVRAGDADAAVALVERLLDRIVPASATRRISAAPRVEDEEPVGPRSPEDFESTLRATPLHRSEPAGDGRRLKVAWFTGPSPLERVDVEEAAERVTITLWERLPPAYEPDGSVNAMALIGRMRCVEVELDAPLGDRDVYDGATGARPADIVPGNGGERGSRTDALALDLERFPCLPRPSGEPVPWDAPW